MALTTELISSAQVIAQVIPNASFDQSLLDQRILKTQRQYVRPLISEDFYEELQTQVAGGSLTPANETLLENYIQPMLAHYILYEALPSIRNNVTSSGVMDAQSDFAIPSTRSDFAALRNQILSDAEVWRGEVLLFIKDEQEADSSAYPLFTNKDKNTYNKYGIIPY